MGKEVEVEVLVNEIATDNAPATTETEAPAQKEAGEENAPE